MKHTEPALAAYAEFVPLYAREHTYPFVYARAKGKDVVLVILNPSGTESSADFPWRVPSSNLRLLAGKEVRVKRNSDTLTVTVPGRSYAIYKAT